MNYSQYYPVDVVNGPGTRATLFVSGCEHQCKGCYNKSTWSCDAGHEFDEGMVKRIIADLNDTRVRRRGLSLSGGDPLHPNNVDAILSLVKTVREHCSGKDIWLWSGYEVAQLNDKQRQVVREVDVIIDGQYRRQQSDPSLKWRGSSNQIIYHSRCGDMRQAVDLMT
ncbi:anaerobic ribonucleoside-triphosphate reductase-activating protein [Echinimonas agarilytica]|uniref:Anaerobic ribonucleoside-triphosphate reductase-activating protein n=1 Tax=Echinimonas agarilytica TaxID=1215918 RepID=A0AA41W401_9GAMM|nr:anaerobic ribonucleoside-triphosphate reductase-activating protein [Echinimonas agarilytica]MCM2678362.1 anaerobic ribonucleoside-triphosphate reductase-activating protein [Echinimonas agarilytica]